jgi:hypothetical protein
LFLFFVVCVFNALRAQHTWVDHSHEAVRFTGTDIVDAIIRSNPSYSTETGAVASDVRMAAERINLSTVFGAMSKHRFPIQNLMAAAKYASAYSTSNDRGTVLLLPHASTDLLRSTRRENMVYSISGPDLLQRNKGKPIDMQFEDSYVDPATNVRIVIHRPFPTFQSGVANPDVGPGPLTDVVSFASYYVLPKGNLDELRIVDFHNRCWHNMGARKDILEKGFSSSATGDGFKNAFFGDEFFDTTLTEAMADDKFDGGGFDTYIVEEQGKLDKLISQYILTDRSGRATLGKQREAIGLALAQGKVMRRLADVIKEEKLNEGGRMGLVAKYKGEYAVTGSDDDIEFVLLRPRMNAVMSSGILAAPGAETGELLVGYPFTSVSTSSTEIVKIQLRVYLGAVMKRPENVILLRNIFFEGLREGSGTQLWENGKAGIGDEEPMVGDMTVLTFPKSYLKAHSKIDYADFTDDSIKKLGSREEMAAAYMTQAQLIMLGMVGSGGTIDADLINDGVPTVVYQGACAHRLTGKPEWAMQQKNNGHLGNLDNPDLADRLFGTFAYSDAGGV